MAALCAGCVSRKLLIHSEPPGARLTLDGQVVGTTPFEGPFLSYGTRRVELEKEGYVRMVTSLELTRPWWQVIPIDFVTDLLWPFTIHDVRSFSYTMQPLDPEAGTWDDARAVYEHYKQRPEALGGRSGS